MRAGCAERTSLGGLMDSDSQPLIIDVESRRRTLSQLADFLKQQQAAITDQWLLAVRRDPKIGAADRLTHQQLLDHLPDIYEECCSFLRTRDAQALVEGAKDDAKTHGGIRWADGYKIDELIRELEIFRGILSSAVGRFGDLDPLFRGAVEASANVVMNRFFGEVTVNSVSQYAQEQHTVVATYTRQLESANLELSRANAGLQRALSERQRLTAVIAHEVRNFLQGLRSVSETGVEVQHQADYALSQLRDVETLLTQLLDHSTLIANREPMTPTEFDTATLHEELVQLYRPQAQRKALAFLGSCADAPRTVFADRLKIKQIACNLLSNALNYTAQGHVALTFERHDASRWVLRVADTGPGLSTAGAARLFGGLAGESDVIPRHGIGLAITKDLVDVLSGTIQVVTKDGAGTLIEVLLPIGTSGNKSGTLDGLQPLA
jgi:signal transduction histidine kinase